MRLTVFSFDYPPLNGGIARLCNQIANSIAGSGVVTRVISAASQGDPPESGGAVEHRIDLPRFLRELRAVIMLARPDADEVVLCSRWYPEGLLAFLAGARPRLILAHGSELFPPRAACRRWLWRLLQRKTLESADGVIANSRYTRDLVLRVAPRARVRNLSLGVDTNRFTAVERQAARARFSTVGKIAIGSVSRLQAHKGHDVVLKAIAELPAKTRENLVYLIAGMGPNRVHLEAEATRLGVADHIRWLGHVPEPQLPDVYRACDLFVLCSRAADDQRAVEGFGLVYLEAQACGTPVVGTRTGGIPDAIEDGKGGWLIDEDDHLRLSQILETLVMDLGPFQEAGRTARVRIEQYCTLGHYQAKLSHALSDYGISEHVVAGQSGRRGGSMHVSGEVQPDREETLRHHVPQKDE
jgi:phosphatidylinositol alpha-1,6-mannosyltransferase